MFKNGFWMLLSTALRLASGLLVFIVVARQLGAASFGTLMTGFAAAGILAIPLNYGFSVLLLNEAAKAEDRGARLLLQAMWFKALLLLPMLALLLFLGWWLGLPLVVTLLLFGMHVAEGCTELICVRLRAVGEYDRETRFVTTQALLQLLLIALVAWWSKSLEWVAAAFLLSRLASLTIAASRFWDVGSIALKSAWADSVSLARRASPFFFDFSAQSVLVQIDAVLLGAFSGPVAVGTYQAGMRVAHGVSQLITVMVNVVLPRLSRQSAAASLGAAMSCKVMVGFALTGFLLAAPFIGWAPEMAELLFGASFQGLGPVLQVLGVFLVVRFSAAGSGLLLIALGAQRMRAAVMVMAIGVLGLLAFVFMPVHGALGAAYAMTGAYGFIFLAFSLLAGLQLKRLGNVR